jgi:SAM-dependent methyltransferase
MKSAFSANGGDKLPPVTDLRDWFRGEAGRAVALREVAVANELLQDLFGYHMLQVGSPYPDSLIAASRIGHQIVMDRTALSGPASVLGRGDALPFQSGAIDVLVLPHGLEFAGNPQAVLREVERVLIPEGYLLLFGFNPWSVYGAWRLAIGWRGSAPWHGLFLPLSRLKDWLTVLGFEVDRSGGLSYRPPLQDAAQLAGLAWLERLGGHFWPFAGNVFWILARKRVMAVRPIRLTKARQPRLHATGRAEPSVQRNEMEPPDA